MPEHPIENYIGENMHEFTIATVYEGPNPVLADVGAPNAMTRNIRNKYLEPIGVAEVNGSFGLGPKMKFGWFIAKTVMGSWLGRGDLSGVDNLFPEKRRYVKRALETKSGSRSPNPDDHRQVPEEIHGPVVSAGRRRRRV